jgi:hypothetical protein
MAPVPEITDAEIQAARERSPEEARNLEQSRDRMRRAREAYEKAFAPMRADLATAGYPVDSVGALLVDFERTGIPYKAAIPVLVAWLPAVDHLPLCEDMVRTLGVPWAKPEASQALVALFESGWDQLRWAVGNALEHIGDPALVPQVVRLVGNVDYGNARDPLIRALGKAKRPEAVPVLIGLLDDQDTAYSAIGALGKLKATAAARDKLIGLRDHHPEAYVRKAAEKALQRLGRPTDPGRAEPGK